MCKIIYDWVPHCDTLCYIEPNISACSHYMVSSYQATVYQNYGSQKGLKSTMCCQIYLTLYYKIYRPQGWLEKEIYACV